MSLSRAAAVGVFDSGLGGLTIVREIRRKFPKESIIYFGDIARLPYGIKSREQIIRFSSQNAKFLSQKKVKAIIVACNSSSSAAYRSLKESFKLPILDVIEPAVEAAVRQTRKNRIGVIATQATIESRAYEKVIHRHRPKAKVFPQSCPLFVPLVEEGRFQGKIVEKIIREYLEPLKKKGIDVLILGCTHYPLLKRSIQKVVGKHIRLIDSAGPTTRKLKALFQAHGLGSSSSKRGKLRVFVSDKPRHFVRVSEKFLGEKLKSVKIIRR